MKKQIIPRHKHPKTIQPSDLNDDGDVIVSMEDHSYGQPIEKKVDEERKGFIQIPWTVVANKALSPIDRLLYGVLVSYSRNSGYAWASNGRYAEILKVSKNTVSSSIKNLKDHDLIRVEACYPFRHIYMIQQ